MCVCLLYEDIAVQVSALKDGELIDVKAAIITFQAELGHEDHLIAVIGDDASNQALVVPIAIDVGCIEKEDTKLYCPMDCFDGFILVCRSV